MYSYYTIKGTWVKGCHSSVWSSSINLISPSAKKPDPPTKKIKQDTKWDLNGTSKDMGTLDFSDAKGEEAGSAINARNEIPSQEEVNI